jgi:hypothetical protein
MNGDIKFRGELEGVSRASSFLIGGRFGDLMQPGPEPVELLLTACQAGKPRPMVKSNPWLHNQILI